MKNIYSVSKRPLKIQMSAVTGALFSGGKFFLLLVLATFMIAAQAQMVMEENVPSAVTIAFAQARPDVNKVKWHKAWYDYEARFSAGKADMTQVYDASGKLIEIRTGVAFSKAPPAAIEYVLVHFPPDALMGAWRVTDAFGTGTYVLLIKGMKLRFDQDGNPIKAYVR